MCMMALAVVLVSSYERTRVWTEMERKAQACVRTREKKYGGERMLDKKKGSEISKRAGVT